MYDSIITYEQLQEIFGRSSIPALAAKLERQGIPYTLGKHGRPFTTFTALNHAMGVPVNSVEKESVNNTQIIEII